MTVLNLFPARIQWVDGTGKLTLEAYRALQILLERVGGTSTNTSLTSLQAQLDSLVLDDLVDVEITTPATNDVLVYTGTLWENRGPTLARDALGLGTGNPTNGQLLIGNGTDFTTATLGTGDGISATAGAGSLNLAANLTEGAGINITPSSGALVIATDLVAGTGMGISNVAGQLTFNTQLAAGANISITGTSTRTIAVTGLGSMAFQSTGASGSFTTADTPPKTVTVTNGIITSIA